MFSSVERERSVSSMRRTKAPRWWRANSQLKSAVRAPPTWRWPVGLGANRTRTGEAISVRLEQPTPGGAREGPDARPADRRIPEEVVVDVRGERGPDHQGRVEQEPLERPQRPAPDQLVAPDHEAAARLEAHRDRRRVRVAEDLDPFRVRHAESTLLAHPEVRDRQGIEPHDPRRDRVDRHLIRRGQDQVPETRHHRPGPRAVAHHGPVHYRKHARMQLPLHVHQVDEHLVHELVCIVAHFLQQAAERVLDRAGGAGVPMRVMQDYAVPYEGVGSLNREIVEKWNVRWLTQDFVDPIPGDVFAGEEPHVGDLVHESPGRVETLEEIDEVADCRARRLGVAVLDVVGRAGSARARLSQPQSPADHSKQRRSDRYRVPVAWPPCAAPTSYQTLEIPLLVRATESHVPGEHHDIVAIDRDPRVLLLFSHAPVRRSAPSRAHERDDAEAGEKHLDLAREAPALRRGAGSALVHRPVAIEIGLDKRRDLVVGALEEDIGHRLRRRIRRNRETERLEEGAQIQSVEVDLVPTYPRLHAEQRPALCDVVRAHLGIGVRDRDSIRAIRLARVPFRDEVAHPTPELRRRSLWRLRPDATPARPNTITMDDRSDDPSLDADIVLVSGSDANSVDVKRVVAQGCDARQTLARALDPDPASDRDAIPQAQFLCQPPAVGGEERVSARRRDPAPSACPYRPDRLVIQRRAPEVGRVPARQVSLRQRDDANLTFAHAIAVR